MVSRQGFEEYCFSDSVLRPDKAGLSADLLKKHKKDGQTFGRNNIFTIFALPFRKYFCREDNIGEVVEWSITAVLKTVELKGSGGSNPSLSAEKGVTDICNAFFNFSVTKNVTKISVRPIFHSKKMQVDSGGHIRKPESLPPISLTAAT